MTTNPYCAVPGCRQTYPHSQIGHNTSGCMDCDRARELFARREGTPVNYRPAGHCPHCDCDNKSHRQHRMDELGRSVGASQSQVDAETEWRRYLASIGPKE